MKKIIALILALAICFAFAGCEKKTGDSQTEAEAAEKIEPTETPEPTTERQYVPELEENPASEEVPTANSLIINSEPYVITTETGFDNAGFTELYVDTTASYSFTAKDSEEVEWSVYVLDERFEDTARFIPQAYEAALEGNGTLELTGGQYLYIYCSVNTFTADEIIDGPAYEIFYSE